MCGKVLLKIQDVSVKKDWYNDDCEARYECEIICEWGRKGLSYDLEEYM
jgi:hypothetical protein